MLTYPPALRVSKAGRYPLNPKDIFYEWRAHWHGTAHTHQQLPVNKDWQAVLLLGGRGCGKSKAMSQNLSLLTVEHGFIEPIRALLMAPTANDIRFTCFEGESGLINCVPPIFIKNYNKSTFELEFNFGIGHLRGISADTYERLRGPQFHLCAADELAAFRYASEVMLQLDLCMRLQHRSLLHPRRIYATTPKSIPTLWNLVTKARDSKNLIFLETATTFTNKENLANTFIENLSAYIGTDVGKQEVFGVLAEPGEGAIIKRSWLKLFPSFEINPLTQKREEKALPVFKKIVMSIDPAFTDEASVSSKLRSDPDYTAISVVGLFYNAIKKRDEALLLYAMQGRWSYPSLLKVLDRELRFSYGEQMSASAQIKPQPLPDKLREDEPLAGVKITNLLIEEKACGLSLIQSMREHFKDKNISISVDGFNPGHDGKTERLHTVSTVFFHGCFHVLESTKVPGKFANWADELVSQLTTYSGKSSLPHDDYVDSLVQAVHFLSRFGKMVSTTMPDAAGEKARPKFTNYYG